MSKDIFDYKIETVFKEWDFIQSHIGRFDTLAFNVKGWSISVFAALLAISVSQKIPSLILLAIIPIILLWIVDALFKSFQRRYILRGREIEKYLASESFITDVSNRSGGQISGPGLSRLFYQVKLDHKIKLLLESVVAANVMAIYVPMIGFCVMKYFFLISFN